jgi:hypothetical protein
MSERFTPDHFTEQELKMSFWYVNNKLKIQKGILLAVLVATVALMLWAVYLMVDIWALNGRAYQMSMQKVAAAPGQMAGMYLAGEDQVQDVQIIQTEVFALGDGRYDIMAELGNLNEKYYAQFEYRFVTAAGQTAWQGGAVLPGQTRYVYALNESFDGVADSAEVEFREFKWRAIPGFAEFTQQRQRMNIDGIRFVPGAEAPEEEVDETEGNGDEAEPVALVNDSVQFTLKNDSTYSFKRVPVFVVAYVGNRIQAINKITVPRVMANSSRDITVPWYQDLGVVSRVEIYPQVDIVDDTVYLEK